MACTKEAAAQCVVKKPVSCSCLTSKKRALSSSSLGKSEKVPVAKRQPPAAKEVPDDLRRMCSVVHQFGLVGAPNYDTKCERLRQILERLPAGSGAAVVFAEPTSAIAVGAVVDAYRKEATESTALAQVMPMQDWQRVKVPTPCRSALDRSACDAGLANPTSKLHPSRACSLPVQVEVVIGRTPELPRCLRPCRYVINYDLPATGRQYLSRLGALTAGDTGSAASVPGVAYSFFEEPQLESRRCREIAGLAQRARRAAAADPDLGGLAKAAEFDSALQQLDQLDEECDGADEEASREGDSTDSSSPSCDCRHCKGRSIGAATYHAATLGAGAGQPPQVEVMRLPLRALEDLAAVAPLIAPRLPDHTCTLICLHNLNCHTPWDGNEQLFALPEGMGSVRVVMVLAEDCSWHDYPDVGSFCGGVAWMDILDPASMDRTDELIARLVEHEVALLRGRGERLFLVGMSQGGAQSMLRFLRSSRRLGGWLGAVCHAPTSPHLPRRADPLLLPGRPTVNLDRPMRLLGGELDSVFPASLVRRDVERLRAVGGFADVQLEVQEGLRHEGPQEEVEAEERGESRKRSYPRELLFLQRHLPAMLYSAAIADSPISP